MKILSRYLLLLGLFLVAILPGLGQSLTAERILEKNLDAIAPITLRQQLKTLFAGGVSAFTSKIPIVKGGGRVVVISDADDLYFLMSLNSKEYPFEKIGMFGEKVDLPFITAGQRSVLGAFLNEHPRILSNNLFCGSMSMRWISKLQADKDIKLKTNGTKKINGRESYLVDAFLPGMGSDEFSIRLFFDSSTFQHVRTEYHRTIRIGQISVGKANQLTDAQNDLVEEFSDFRSLQGFTLPYNYKVTFKSNSNSQEYESVWGIRVANYYYNQKLASDFFTFDIKDPQRP